jgi:hypothetical protein
MQLSTLRTHVHDLIGQDSATATDSFPNARVDRWLNRSAIHLAEIIAQHAPEELTKTGSLSVVAGTREYNIVDSFSDFLDLHLVERSVTGSDEPVPMVVDRTWQRGDIDIPDRLYLRSHFLGFYVTPSEAMTLTVHYRPAIAAMSSDTHDLASLSFQTPRIREAFANAIVYRTAYHLLMSENSDAMGWKQESAEAELEMIQTLKNRRKGPHYINVLPRLRHVGVRGWR